MRIKMGYYYFIGYLTIRPTWKLLLWILVKISTSGHSWRGNNFIDKWSVVKPFYVICTENFNTDYLWYKCFILNYNVVLCVISFGVAVNTRRVYFENSIHCVEIWNSRKLETSFCVHICIVFFDVKMSLKSLLLKIC